MSQAAAIASLSKGICSTIRNINASVFGAESIDEHPQRASAVLAWLKVLPQATASAILYPIDKPIAVRIMMITVVYATLGQAPIALTLA